MGRPRPSSAHVRQRRRATLAFVACLALANTSAVAAVASDSCANSKFRVGPGAGLPDCRAYEMVSPLDKNGGDVDRDFTNYSQQTFGAGEQGDRVAYTTRTRFGQGTNGSHFP